MIINKSRRMLKIKPVLNIFSNKNILYNQNSTHYNHSIAFPFSTKQQSKAKSSGQQSDGKVTPSPYKVLEVAPNASQQQIKTRYYELAQKYHPDHNPSKSDIQKFKVINQAYQVLKNPEKRKQLDFQLLNSTYTYGANKDKVYSYAKHHYGYTNRKEQQAKQYEQFKQRVAKYSSKPSYTSQVPNHKIFDFGNKQDQKQRRRVSERQKEVKYVLMVGVVLMGLFAVVQLVFKVYQFNNRTHRDDAKILEQTRSKYRQK